MLTLLLHCSLSLTRMLVLQILMAVNAMFLVRSDDEAAAVPVRVCRRHRCPMLHVLLLASSFCMFAVLLCSALLLPLCADLRLRAVRRWVVRAQQQSGRTGRTDAAAGSAAMRTDGRGEGGDGVR